MGNEGAKKKEEAVLRLGAEKLLGTDVLRVNWMLTELCNYTCSYCTVFSKKGSLPSLESLFRAVDRIASFSNSHIQVTLSGGEPTLHPSFEEFLSYLARKLGKRGYVQTITNLSRTPEFYEQLVENLSFAERKRMCFIASFHFDHADIDDFLTRVKVISAKKILVFVHLMAHPDHMPEVRKLIELLEKGDSQFLRYDVDIIREGFLTEPDSRYCAEDLQWLSDYRGRKWRPGVVVEKRLSDGKCVCERTTALEILSRGENAFKGMWCNAGINSISIDERGMLTPAVCFRRVKDDFSMNIYGEECDLHNSTPKPIRCPHERCGCSTDIEIPKYAQGCEPLGKRGVLSRTLGALMRKLFCCL